MQQLASVRFEKLSMQANKLMPLGDITGKTIQQVLWMGDRRKRSAISYSFFILYAKLKSNWSRFVLIFLYVILSTLCSHLH